VKSSANWWLAIVVAVVVGFGLGTLVAGGGNKSAGGGTAAAAGDDKGKTPADLPAGYIKEAELPAGTLAGLTEQQKYSVLKAVNEKNCTCGCANDTIAKCRKDDPQCGTAPKLMEQAVNDAKRGLSAAAIEADLGGGPGGPGGAPQAQNQPPRPPPGPPPAQARKVDLPDNAAMVTRGPQDAKVTIVEFSDFQCPFCGRVEPTLAQVAKEYPNDVRLVWRNQPLPFHPNAMPAAEAACAAGEQGKFWQMHDKLYENQQQLSPENYSKWAQDIGLNMGKFKSSVDSHECKPRIEADSKYGSSVGANGTPTFFINGRQLVGAQPYDQFKAMIDQEIKHADDLMKKGTPKAKLYEATVEDNVKNAPAAPAQPQQPGAPNPNERKTVDIAGAPVRGSPKAPVTIVMFSDFQCPFCGRAEPTVKQLEDEYKDKVKVVWKNQPLPFHPNAMPAAKAAMAAYKQGKFWEMHDKLFSNQQALGETVYAQYAKELGLDMAKFNADMSSPDIAAGIQKDMQQGSSLGANGTPTFFINGRELVGAQPADQFKQIIDDELKKGNVAKGG
jgi:protein-disulfide isomerase